MKIIPSEQLELITPLTIEEVRKTLRENIKPKRGIIPGYNTSKNYKHFEGVLENYSFKIQKISNYRSSFMLGIEGQMQRDLNGTKVTVSLKLRKLVIAIMGVWIGVAFLVFIVSIVRIVTKGVHSPSVLRSLIMLALGYGLVHYLFNIEKEKTINELKNILNAEVKNK